jgi:RHS repeat-associated protein
MLGLRPWLRHALRAALIGCAAVGIALLLGSSGHASRIQSEDLGNPQASLFEKARESGTPYRRPVRKLSDVTGTITPGGSPLTVTIANANDNASITFSGTANQRVSLNITSVSISFSYVSILKPDGSTLTSTAVFSFGKYIDTQTLPTTGTYTIFIDPQGTATGSMTLTLYDVPADASGSITPGGAQVTATTTVPGQNAVETWSGTQGDRVSLNATNISLNHGYEIVQILKPDHTVWFSSGATSSHYFFDTMTLPTTGTYTILVDPQDDATGSTRLTLYSVPADNQGKIVIGGATRSAVVTIPGHNPTFSFSGGAASGLPEPVAVSITASNINLATVTIKDPNGGTVVSHSIGNGATTVDSTTLAIDDPTKRYSLIVDPVVENTGTVTLKIVYSTPWQRLPRTRVACKPRGRHARVLFRCLADPVNSLTGAFTDADTDLTLPGKGLPFAFIRSYNSDDPTTGRLGQGWTDSYAASLAIQQNGDVYLHGEDGQEVRFLLQDDGTFVAESGGLSTLSSVTGGYQLVTQDQVTYRFDGNGKLTSMTDRNGNAVSLAYDGSGRLATITDSAGRTITFTSNADGTLARIDVPDGRSVVYGYTAGRLTSVTDPASHVTTYHYDANGRLDQITDPNGHTQSQTTYGSDGRVTQQTDALGHTTTFSWDSATQTETATDARGNTWKDVYSNNVLLKEIDALGNVTQYGSDVDLNNTSVTSPDGKTTTMAYDSRGNMTSATAPSSLGAQKTFAYNSTNDLTSVTDGRNKVTTYSYDSSGNNTQIVQDGTTIAQRTFNGAGQVLTSTDGRGKTTTYTYDSNGNLASVTDPLGNKTTYGYDSAGRVTSEVDPRGNVTGANPADYTTSYTYDGAGHLLTKTDQLGHTTTYTYDSAGNQTTVTDPKNHTTTTAYDAANRVTSVTAPDGGVTSYTYDAAGNRLTETDPNNHTTTYAYNADNEQTSVTSPKGEVTTSSYDSNGNLTKTVDPRGNVSGANPDDYATTYTYDAAGRLLTETDPLGHTTTHAYDAVGNETSVTDANNHRTSYTYDAAGRILTITAPDGGVTTYTYDAAGNELTRKDGNNHTTTYTYDDAGEVASKTSPLGQQWTYSYDPAGNLKTTVDANGNATQTSGDGTTTYGYDRAGRLTSIDYSDSTPDVTFAYDAAGNRTSMTDGAGTQSRTYDAADRLTGVTRGSDSFSYAYDSAGNLTSRTYPDGTVTSYSYDADNQLASAASGGATTNYSYDVAGELTQTTLPTSNGYVETRSYDRAGRLTEVKNANGSSVLSDFTSTLDAVGNPTTIVRSGATSETATYTYDANDRLTGVCYQTSCPGGSDPFIRWTYDAVGNRLTEARPSGTTTYTYNAGDELTSAGSTSYSYDQNGNETAAGARTFTYDLANRLVSTTSGSTTTNYTYDGDANRLQASTGSQNADTTSYLWDESGDLPSVAIERDGGGALLRRYIYGRELLSMTSGGHDFFYHYDALENVANVTSSSGASEWTYAYEPFGATRTATQDDQGAPANVMKFAGALADSTGLYHLRAREYDPTVARFLQLDPAPAMEGAATSSFLYAGDMPTTQTDPSGMHFRRIGDGQQAAGDAASRGLDAYSPQSSENPGELGGVESGSDEGGEEGDAVDYVGSWVGTTVDRIMGEAGEVRARQGKGGLRVNIAKIPETYDEVKEDLQTTLTEPEVHPEVSRVTRNGRTTTMYKVGPIRVNFRPSGPDGPRIDIFNLNEYDSRYHWYYDLHWDR